MRLLFLPESFTTPSARFRVWQFLQHLRKIGFEVETRVIQPDRYWKSNLTNKNIQIMQNYLVVLIRIVNALYALHDANKYDLIFLNKDIVPEKKIYFLEPWLAKKNPRLIFDFDDAIHLYKEEKLRKILPFFAWITAGNEYLAAFAQQINSQVSIWPTVVDTDFYRPVLHRKPGPVRIGWSGSSSTMQKHLPLIKEEIVKLAKDEEFEFIIIAEVPPTINWPGVKWRYIPWTPETEVAALQEIDIGLMPLMDEPFEQGKCGLKAIQYMGVGVPALVSPVGVNREIVVHGENGFHCSNGNDWVNYLRIMIHDKKLRTEFGKAARTRVEKYYSVNYLLPKMIDIFKMVAKL